MLVGELKRAVMSWLALPGDVSSAVAGFASVLASVQRDSAAAGLGMTQLFALQGCDAKTKITVGLKRVVQSLV